MWCRPLFHLGIVRDIQMKNTSEKKQDVAAYIRAEGTLFKKGALSLAAYLAANGQSFSERAMRLGQLALSAPVLGLFGQTDRGMANRATYVSLRNMSEDRLRLLADEYAKDVLKHQVRKEGVELIKRLQKEGKKVILLSDQLERVIAPVVAELRLGDVEVVANELEIHHGEVTGKLRSPVIGGHGLALWVKEHAATSGLNLEGSYAYASQAPDLLFLAAVGHPCAVNPDPTLRRSAQEANWPVMTIH